MLLNIVELDECKRIMSSIIQNHINIYGKVPGSKEWDRKRYKPARKVLEKKFSMIFNEIIVQLGFDPKNKTPRCYNNMELLNILKLQSQIKGSTPTFEELNNIEKISYPKKYI